MIRDLYGLDVLMKTALSMTICPIKNTLGEAGSYNIGEYDTLMEMLEAYLKECFENGWNS